MYHPISFIVITLKNKSNDATQLDYSRGDGLYNLADADLKTSHFLEKHQKVQQWITNTWLCIP